MFAHFGKDVGLRFFLIIIHNKNPNENALQYVAFRTNLLGIAYARHPDKNPDNNLKQLLPKLDLFIMFIAFELIAYPQGGC